MLIVLPLITALTFYLFIERKILFLSTGLTLFYILSQSLFFSSEILILSWIIVLTGIWINNNENSLLGWIFLIGSFLTLTSTSSISLFLSIEILSMTILILINLYIQDQYPGILYYLFSGLFSALFLLSLGYLSLGYLSASKILCIVLFAKLGLVPFHILLPNIYNNLSPQVILLMDIPYKMILFFVLYRLNFLFLDYSFWIALSLIIGAIGSIRYQNLFSVWIYSSLYNYGLILITIHYQAMDYFLYYIFIYSLTAMIFFYLVTSKFINRQIENQIYILFWFLLLINLIGIPPFNGFFIKFQVLYLALYHHSWFFFILVSFGLIFLTYTYLRLLISMMINSRSYHIQLNTTKNAHFLSVLMVLSLWPLWF